MAAVLLPRPEMSLCHPEALGEKALGWESIPSEEKNPDPLETHPTTIPNSTK